MGPFIHGTEHLAVDMDALRLAQTTPATWTESSTTPGLDSDSDQSDSILSITQADEEEWQDLEPDDDEEKLEFISLLDGHKFKDIPSMFGYCKERFGLDFLKTVSELALDDVDLIKLINYIRFEVKNGNGIPNIDDARHFADGEYMLPALEDDALLRCTDDILELAEYEYPRSRVQKSATVDATYNGKTAEERLRDEKGKTQQLQKQLDLVQRVLDQEITERRTRFEYGEPGPKVAVEDDSHYFRSYQYNDVHQTMLKDAVRTESYRDFIYSNPHLFKDKVVLDVGCGTGILSMFCARAGARKVIAVDNSEILHKALQNVWENGLEKVISCEFGKIEEINLSVKEVDIIVSEWMGYCLLYEAMLDSVIYARDHFLKPGGLMIPSHCTLRLAPVVDSDYRSAEIDFWNSVYGFKMTAMLDSVGDDVAIRSFEEEHLCGDSVAFLHLNLNTCTTQDLSFVGRNWEVVVKMDVEQLDGFAIWFDTFFTTNPTAEIFPPDVEAEAWNRLKAEDVTKGKELAFTTGPFGRGTHWQQGMLMIAHLKGNPRAVPLKKGQVIKGTIGYKKRAVNSRELDIDMKWDAGDPDGQGKKEAGRKVWFMR